MRRLTPGWPRALVLISLLTVAGCGSSSQHAVKNVTVKRTPAVNGAKTFSAPGMAIHFQYPASFQVEPLAQSRHLAGHPSSGTHAAVGVGSYDLLVISRFPGLPVPVTTRNIASLKSSFDKLMGNVFGRPMTSTIGTAGGLPALFYPRKPVSGLPVPATSQNANVFVGHDEYELECQATAAKLAVIEGACKQMVATLSK